MLGIIQACGAVFRAEILTFPEISAVPGLVQSVIVQKVP